jgi:integrase
LPSSPMRFDAAVVHGRAARRSKRCGIVFAGRRTRPGGPRRLRRPVQAFQPWDAAEINAFLDTLEGNAYGPLFTLAIATGLRQGELLGLRWSDVDLDAGTLTVTRPVDASAGDGRAQVRGRRSDARDQWPSCDSRTRC